MTSEHSGSERAEREKREDGGEVLESGKNHRVGECFLLWCGVLTPWCWIIGDKRWLSLGMRLSQVHFLILLLLLKLQKYSLITPAAFTDMFVHVLSGLFISNEKYFKGYTCQEEKREKILQNLSFNDVLSHDFTLK